MKRCFAELANSGEAPGELSDIPRKWDVTLVHPSKDEKHNKSVALKEYLETRLNNQAG